MEKYINRLFIILFAFLPFSFSSCSDDDEDEYEEPVVEGKIKINNVLQDISDADPYLFGTWYDNFGSFIIQVKNAGTRINHYDPEYYIFEFVTTYETPQKGVDLANEFLRIDAHADSNVLSVGCGGTIFGGPLKYISGRIIVEDVDIPNRKMTVRLKNLTAEATTILYLDGEREEHYRRYTFDGRATVDMYFLE